MFEYNPDIHDEDDVIECLLSEMMLPSYAGGCLQVPGYLRINSYDYDRFMEPTVREKMYRHGVARRCTGQGQPETAVMITPKGMKVAKAGGWKAYLKKLEQEAIVEALRKEELRNAELNRTSINAKQVLYNTGSISNSNISQSRDSLRPAALPRYHPVTPEANNPIRRATFMSIISNNPLWSGIVATVIGGVIYKIVEKYLF